MSVLDQAILLAVRAHSGMERKMDRVPYILHPLETAVIASTITKDAEVLAAAVLHDVVEDAGVTVEEIRSLCGGRVADLVAAETEEKYRDRPADQTWKQRKAESLEELRKAEDPGVRIMFLADKLANMRSISRMKKQVHDALWDAFNEKDPKTQEWYYRSVAELTEDLKDSDAWQEYNRLIDAVFGGTGDA